MRSADRGEPQTWENDHNVYVLGAGFSADAGYPLINGFLNRMRDAVEWCEGNNYESEASAIRRVLAFRLKATGAAYRVKLDLENIEELFSLASASGIEGLESDLALAIAGTLEYCKANTNDDVKHNSIRLVQLPEAQKKPGGWKRTSEWDVSERRRSSVTQQQGATAYIVPAYDIVASVLSSAFMPSSPKRRDTIISFNYDLLLEESFESIGVKYNYGFDPAYKSIHFSNGGKGMDQPNSIPLLKLHGSLNWGRNISGVVETLDVFSTYREVSAAKQAPLLVPPTWRKTYGLQLAAVWNRAVHALSRATRIILVGFSLPSTDVHFKYLLGAALKDNISLRRIYVVDPDFPDLGSDESTPLGQRLLDVFRNDAAESSILTGHQTRTLEHFTYALRNPSQVSAIGRYSNLNVGAVPNE